MVIANHPTNFEDAIWKEAIKSNQSKFVVLPDFSFFYWQLWEGIFESKLTLFNGQIKRNVDAEPKEVPDKMQDIILNEKIDSSFAEERMDGKRNCRAGQSMRFRTGFDFQIHHYDPDQPGHGNSVGNLSHDGCRTPTRSISRPTVRPACREKVTRFFTSSCA